MVCIGVLLAIIYLQKLASARNFIVLTAGHAADVPSLGETSSLYLGRLAPLIKYHQCHFVAFGLDGVRQIPLALVFSVGLLHSLEISGVCAEACLDEVSRVRQACLLLLSL